MARSSGGERVLQKHLRVLDCLDALHPFRTLQEIAAAAGLAPSTAHRIVHELESEGLVERLPDRTYRLGIRLWEYASRTPGALGLREIARPWMAAVQAQVRQHTQLGILNGTDVLFVERMSAPDAVVNATLIGGRIPLAVSSSGLVLLAHSTQDTVDRVIAKRWPHHTASTIHGADELREQIRTVKRNGFARLDGHIYSSSRGVAVPVRGPDGSVFAALGVVVPNDGEGSQAVVELLTVAAAGISRSLEQAYLTGYSDNPSAADRGPDPVLATSARSREYFAALRHSADEELLR